MAENFYEFVNLPVFVRHAFADNRLCGGDAERL